MTGVQTCALPIYIKKTSKGGYADYNTSTWARKESALTAEEAAAVEQFGLHNLKDFLPKKPGDVELKVIKEMFEASVDGQPYDPDRWANYYKPAGLQTGNGSTGDEAPAAKPVAQAPVARPAPATVAQDDVPFDTDETPAPTAPVSAPASGSSKRAEDILAMIRNRQK